MSWVPTEIRKVWCSSSGFNSSTLTLIPLTEVIFFCGAIWWFRLRATAITPKLRAVARNITLLLQEKGTSTAKPNLLAPTPLRSHLPSLTTKPQFLPMKPSRKEKPRHLQLVCSPPTMVPSSFFWVRL